MTIVQRFKAYDMQYMICLKHHRDRQGLIRFWIETESMNHEFFCLKINFLFLFDQEILLLWPNIFINLT